MKTANLSAKELIALWTVFQKPIGDIMAVEDGITEEQSNAVYVTEDDIFGGLSDEVEKRVKAGRMYYDFDDNPTLLAKAQQVYHDHLVVDDDGKSLPFRVEEDTLIFDCNTRVEMVDAREWVDVARKLKDHPDVVLNIDGQDIEVKYILSAWKRYQEALK